MSCILLVSTDDDNPSIVRSLGQLAFALKSKGLRVVIQSSLEAGSPFEKLEGVAVHGLKHHPLWGGSLAYSLKEYCKGKHVVDVVHIFHFEAKHVDVLKVCEMEGLPSVVHVLNEEVINRKNAPLLKRFSFKETLESVACVVVNTPYMETYVKEQGVERVFYIPHGVRTEFYKPVLSKRPTRRKLGLPESTAIVCCMADIHPENKQLEMLKACAPLGSWLHLLFIGYVRDSIYFEEIKAQLQKMDAEAFAIFRNAVDNPEEYLKATDVFMLLGGVETRIQTVLEAMSSGCPVILGSSVSSEMLTFNGEAGVVYDADKNEKVSDKMERLLLESSFRQGRSLKARDFVSQNFNFSKNIERYVALYKGVIETQKEREGVN